MCSKRKKKSAKRRGSRHRAQPRGGEGPPATPNGVAGSPSKRLSNGVAGSPSKRLSNGVAGSPKRQSYASALGSSPPRVSGSPKSARGKLSLENELLHSCTPNGVAGSPKRQSYASTIGSFPLNGKATGVAGSPKSARGSKKREAGEAGSPKSDILSVRGSEKREAGVAACPPLPSSKDVSDFTVFANHFEVNFGVKVQDIEIWQYSVTFTPKPSKYCDLRFAIMRQLFDNYRNSHLGGRNPAFDDDSNRILTNGELPFRSNVFYITLYLEDGNMRDFKVELEVCQGPNIVLQKINNLCEVSWAINVILHQSHHYNTSYVKDKRALYSLKLGEKLSLPGVEFFRGFYQTIRPTQMGLSLNVDICSTGFFRAGNLLEFVQDLLQTELSNKRLRDDEIEKLRRYLKRLLIKVTYGDRRQYSICDLSSSPAYLLTYNTKGRSVYVPEHFQSEHGISLEFDNFPCLRVVEPQGGIPTYLPMEVCTIEKGQRSPYHLHDNNEICDIRKYKVNYPSARKSLIVKAVENSSYGTNGSAACEFKLSVSETLSEVQARLLPEPKRMKCTVTAQQNHAKDLFIGGSVENWCCILFSKDLIADNIKTFCNAICTSCVNLGMKFKKDSVIGWRTVDLESEEVGGVLRDQLRAVNMMGVQLDLLIAILPDDHVSLYGDLKRICETDLGIVSQCFQIRTFHKVVNARVHSSMLETVALKINAKIGGKNSVLADANSKAAPGISMVPTIIFGADVTHYPHKSQKSIAAVVACQDWPDVSQYASVVRAQAAGKEIIQELRQMIKKLLESYINANEKKRPERVIFYRDGVGESEFSQILSDEFGAIKKACEDIAPGYKPTITFVVVQKRHHTRLFVGSDKRYAGKDGNILPGTVVDSEICQPQNPNFYLCSHNTNRGTVRPTHYTSLRDENNFNTSDLETLTHDLCYTYARCTKPVSLVPPVYYAHLAAYRARSYWEPDGSLSEPKESLKMFFI